MNGNDELKGENKNQNCIWNYGRIAEIVVVITER